MPPKKPAKPTPVETHIHYATRTNIPTHELRDFAADYEGAPTVVHYPRDPSLDPQLVWKGKEEQDSHDLAVEVVPIYIQEKIHPQALIQDLQAHGAGEAQLDLFAGYDALTELDQKVEFYQHDEKWQNRMVLGDSLVVMSSLAEKEGLKGKAQMIYLDPPYGIKFGSNWQVSTRKRDVKDGKAEDATRQPEQVRAFRDTWKLGIHSYLSYLRDRLTVARELLTETGSIFVQIGDENVHLVRNIMDEVFGSEGFCSQIAVRKTTSEGSTILGATCDYILWYGKKREETKSHVVYVARSFEAQSKYDQMMLSDGIRRVATLDERESVGSADGRLFRMDTLTSSRPAGAGDVREFTWNGETFSPGNGTFKTTMPGLYRLGRANRLQVTNNKKVGYTRFADDFGFMPIANLWNDISGAVQSRSDPKVYVVQTSTEVIQRCILLATDPGDLVLDPTCGSGTTAYVAEQWGRRWITIDTSRVALALARTRLMAAKYPYYLLSDSPEGVRKEADLSGQVPPTYATGGDVRKGFIYKRVPHVTLKSIANNAEVDTIHTAFLPDLDTQRALLNKALGKAWEEWEIPREVGPTWSADAQAAHASWWTLRRERQAKIDASIARAADTELLYDQPYEDNKRVRVSGPFTVESLSPHRILSTDENNDGVVSPREAQESQDFTTMILDNLRKAGVQNTKQGERLKFDTLEPYAGAWIQAEGRYTDSDGKAQRVAVSIGPEYGTVGPEQVREAAKEAVHGIGFDVLIVCGFAFDPHVDEETKRIGRLTVLPARMNPDLAMGDELLKKTGAGNLFMVFGEPDIAWITDKEGQITVTIHGLDVYDPTTGQVRSSSTDDIACWFIDTDYNEESFFVRHAYFTGADEPYEKLQRALKADVDADAWQSLYSTVSRPFPAPKAGRIAVKVINHYGDEVLKVYKVGK